MRARVTKLVAALAAVGAFAVGGAALAGASSTPTPPAPAAPAVPLQSDVQQGDQTAPDLGASSESGSESASTESSSESATANDGPGGHADEPGNPNADYQFQGEQ